jgi:hypothetical protein
MQAKNLAFTITDGWAFRFFFVTGLYKEIQNKYNITLICSKYYFNKINKNYREFDDNVQVVKLGFNNNYKVFFKSISLLNFIFKNVHDFNLNKYHILKRNWLPRQFYLVLNILLKNFKSTKLIETIVTSFKIDKPFKSKEEIDIIYFLSPYLKEEIALSLSYKKDKTKLCFILPSWDNIYKYYTFKHFDSYIVWGESQQFFLKNTMNINSPIYLKGPISQYIFNNYIMSDSYNNYLKPSSSVNLLYCTITPRNFPNEVNFVKDLINKINNDVYGNNCHLTIRLHPAEKDVDSYRDLVSNKVSISYSKGVSSLYDWDVDERFFLDQIEDFINSDIVITVASTITIDAIILNRPVINFKPKILNGKVDLYQLDHYKSVTNSNELEIVESIEELDSVIKEILSGKHKNYRKSISKEVFLHDSSEISNYLEI